MAAARLLPLTATIALLAACVTINVYFPAVAAEKAADRIIGDVWGKDGTPPPEGNGDQEGTAPEQAPPAEDPEARGPQNTDHGALARVTAQTLNWLISPAAAQSPDIDINTPAVNRLTNSMEARYQRLKPYYGSGAVGLTNDALISVRKLGAVSLAKRNTVKQLVSKENADRKALYAEIARANDHPEWEPQIREVFARRWIANARSGWYYQNDGGDWVQK